ncbi:HNH endonuclease signature motif containing protein [Streptomyces sp. XD-27]|uniref:HNH endonuclease signature motif containing protein n=1 Tax=Streptomyces sp. XD-27 TaxID=3062779 RepID=UPI0026F44CA3|nr:HNH endonuclease signature motif containing protein [Streptomyces sp. XD-27]WKX70575.1 HNH endonuclease signature motif containing protein [Streptomyces sp. XD-27]
MSDPYERGKLAAAVAESKGWADLMRRLGVKESGGRRRVLQRMVAEYGLDTGHFTRRSPWRAYPDEKIAAAAASSTSLREVAAKLGARPATGTLSHLRRRIAAAGIDISHFPGMHRSRPDLPFTTEELATAAAKASSMRGVARELGVPDDGRSRAALGRMLREQHIDTRHFTSSRLALPDGELREAISKATSYADVMRRLGLAVNDANHRRVQRCASQLRLDTSHFTRKSRRAAMCTPPKRPANEVLRMHSDGSPRVNRERLHRALRGIGVPYRCDFCGNGGEWRGKSITLQIDHVNGDWLDNRPENLRYLCPNCHATTDTWCRNRGRRRQAGA